MKSGARWGRAMATFTEAVLPIIAPSLIGVALFGFTLSYDELARSIGGSTATAPRPSTTVTGDLRARHAELVSALQ